MSKATQTALSAIHRLQEREKVLNHEKLLLLINIQITRGNVQGRVRRGKDWFNWSFTLDGHNIDIYEDTRRNRTFYGCYHIESIVELEAEWNKV